MSDTNNPERWLLVLILRLLQIWFMRVLSEDGIVPANGGSRRRSVGILHWVGLLLTRPMFLPRRFLVLILNLLLIWTMRVISAAIIVPSNRNSRS